MPKRLSIILGFVCVLAIGCGTKANSESASSSSEITSQASSKKAPDFKLTDLSGKSFSLSDFKGKVVFLDFWATWCPPCVQSSPQVEKMVEDFKGKKVEIISISLDTDEKPVKDFVASHHLLNRVALAGDSGVDEKYGIHGIPSFFIIDQKGNVAGGWEGYNPAMPAIWRKELNRLLGI